RAAPVLMAAVIVAVLLLHAGVWVVSLFTGAPGPTWRETAEAIMTSPANPVAGYAHDAGPAWAVYVLVGVVAVILLAAAAFVMEARRQRKKVDKKSLPKPARYGQMHRERAVATARDSLQQVLSSQQT